MTEASSAPDDKIRVPLSKEVLAHGEMVKKLVFREPTGADITRCGNPVKINFATDPPDITFDEVKMTRMLSALAAVPESTIGALPAGDWAACSWSIAGFFVPSATMSSTPAAG